MSGLRFEASIHRYPNLTTLFFDTGSHMLIGNETMITAAIRVFYESHHS